jgi:hypothetical protein
MLPHSTAADLKTLTFRRLSEFSPATSGEMAYAEDLKFSGAKAPCGFESRPRHHGNLSARLGTGDAELPKFAETCNGNPERSLKGMLHVVAHQHSDQEGVETRRADGHSKGGFRVVQSMYWCLDLTPEVPTDW